MDSNDSFKIARKKKYSAMFPFRWDIAAQILFNSFPGGKLLVYIKEFCFIFYWSLHLESQIQEL